jgi:hypothetical protein
MKKFKFLFLLQVMIAYIVLIATVILFCYFYNFKISVKSNIDGRYYVVKNNILRQESADLLANLNNRLIKLIENVEKSPEKPVYVENLKKFNPSRIHENVINFDTTYTLDKGSYMAFCLGPRNENKITLYDINTLMYVAIHELAHIASTSIGHTDEFKKNFADLLRRAIDIGLYEYVDYSVKPIDYCGIKLTKNILA